MHRPILPSTAYRLRQLNFSWDPVLALPGVAISYHVEVTNLGTGAVFQRRNLAINYLAFSDEDIANSPCDEYQFRVQAENAAGTGSFSNEVQSSLPFP